MAANSEFVIVNFEALESAIDSFKTSANHILDISERVKANAAAIQSAMVSDASNTYVGKANTYAANVNTAKGLLDGHVQDLENKLNEARATEVRAQSIADGVNTFNMQ